MHLSTHNRMRAEPLELTLKRIKRLGFERIEISGEPKQYPPKECRPLLKKLGCTDDVLDEARPRRPVGCDECRDTGYLGRTGVFEVMPMTEALQKLVQDGALAADLKRAAVADGMQTLRNAALDRALAGETSLEEVLRAIA